MAAPTRSGNPTHCLGLMCHPEAGRRAIQGFDCLSGPHWTGQFSFIYSAGIYQEPLLAVASTWEIALNECNFYSYGANGLMGKTDK